MVMCDASPSEGANLLGQTKPWGAPKGVEGRHLLGHRKALLALAPTSGAGLLQDAGTVASSPADWLA